VFLKVMNYHQVPAQDVAEEGAEGVRIRWLVTKEDGAPNFAMRHFEIEPGGHTPFHSHPWEHEVFILRGTGKVVREGRNAPISEGTFVYVPPGEEHQFRNDGSSQMDLICLIPNPSD
jgi:quercetin dioxygenase-like cupin family protein